MRVISTIFYKKGAPIVIALNGSNHFAPTIIMNAPETQQCLLDTISTLGWYMLDICQTVDINYITDTAHVQLEVLKKAMTDSITVLCGSTSCTSSSYKSKER